MSVDMWKLSEKLIEFKNQNNNYALRLEKGTPEQIARAQNGLKHRKNDLKEFWDNTNPKDRAEFEKIPLTKIEGFKFKTVGELMREISVEQEAP